MRLRAAALLGGAALALGMARPAEAKFFDIYAGPRFGVAQGAGGGAKRGAVAGVQAGLELVLFDAMFDFSEIVGGKDAGASLTQLLLGADGDIPLDGLSHAQTFFRVGAAAGLALVTPKAPHFPLDDKQIEHKGVALQGIAALERHLGRFVIVGLEFTLAYRYMLSHELVDSAAMMQPTAIPPALSPDHWESSTQAMGLITARIHFEPLQ